MSAIKSPISAKAFDPNLAFIAANAATEVDCILLGKEIKSDHRSKLAEILKNSSLDSSSDKLSGARNLINPIGSVVFNKALVVSQNSQISSMEDLKRRAVEISDTLFSLDTSNPSKEDLAELRDFCVALSKYALGSPQSRFRSRTRNARKK